MVPAWALPLPVSDSYIGLYRAQSAKFSPTMCRPSSGQKPVPVKSGSTTLLPISLDDTRLSSNRVQSQEGRNHWGHRA
jgi:hypothetical protein